MTTTTPPAWMTGPITTAGAAPDATGIDAVELLVRDLDVMTDFYQHAVTLDVLDQSGATATLGSGNVPAVVLRQETDLPAANHRGAGLYHTAILFENQARLATALASLAQHSPARYQGSADHLVSEAFYFGDPEGNGLEIYRDRARDAWQLDADGNAVMGSLMLDPNQFLSEWYDPEASVGAETAAVGHVHLQVGDIPTARAFYEGVLGFDVVSDMGTALFVSAGGYHHHIGMNTWRSQGAGPRAAQLGLGDVRLTMPTRDDVQALADRLAFAGVPVADDGRGIRFTDPWQTALTVTPVTE